MKSFCCIRLDRFRFFDLSMIGVVGGGTASGGTVGLDVATPNRVYTLAFSVYQAPSLIEMTPWATRSVTLAGNSVAPTSLNIRTRSPDGFLWIRHRSGVSKRRLCLHVQAWVDCHGRGGRSRFWRADCQQVAWICFYRVRQVGIAEMSPNPKGLGLRASVVRKSQSCLTG